MKKLMLVMMVSVLASAVAHAGQDDKKENASVKIDCKNILGQKGEGGKAEPGQADPGALPAGEEKPVK